MTAAPATGTQRQRASAIEASGSVISTRRTRSVPNAIASRASCQASRASRAACGVNSGSCCPVAASTRASSSSRRATAAGGGAFSRRANSRRSIASASAVGSGRRCSRSRIGGRPAAGEGEVVGDEQPREPGGLAAGLQLVGEGRGQAVEDEPDGVELLGRRVERQAEREPLGGPARA